VAIYKNELINSETHLNKVFVYGTLMKNFWNHKRYLEGRISRIIPGKTYGLLYHLPEGYPALLAGNKIVKGEVIEPVDENLLKSLDRLEGYVEGRSNNLYVRDIKNILTEDGEEMVCWVYIYTDERYAQDNGILVPDGDWRKFMEERGELI
jgi:gamma-glutamylcyclotransferase (GGCT)/AIG2-like uncharacterized protein YtfP